MADRTAIKQADEDAFIDAFIAWHGRAYRSLFRVVFRPDPKRQEPPDAIIQSHRTIRWLEIGNAIWSDEYAQHLYSKMTPGEEHQPLQSGLYAETDKRLASRFVDILAKKLNKASYDPVVERYGPGYLVIPLVTVPGLFDMSTVDAMRWKWSKCKPTDRGSFRSVYIAYRDVSRGSCWFQRWPLA